MNPVFPQTYRRSRLSYDEALAFWYGCINYEQRTPQPDDLKLEQMKALLAQLGNPHEQLRIIHVAGSKGKGSTSAMLAAILREAGFRTGLFTSPHLCRVEERIQVDRRPIAADELTSLLEEVQTAIRELQTRRTASRGNEIAFSPTFFEVATALGFIHFHRRRVDWAIVEVGLGGRLDSTNVCLPEVALITSISLDHTRQLGTDLASIAGEKAGIVKTGRPVISGATVREACSVIERICAERQASLRQLGIDFQYEYAPGKIETDARASATGAVRVRTEERVWPKMELALLGEHQAANAAVAVACIEELRKAGCQILDSAVARGLAGVSWPARMEVVARRPYVVLDCAHNVASAQALASALEASFPPARKILIFASSNDKDVAGMFNILGPMFSHVFLTRYGKNPRSVLPEELARILTQVAGTPSTVCPTAIEAWHRARELATPADLICIAGSVFLAGELRPVLVETSPPNCLF
jgi:dihydrofolate synthase/folylpolyglutamate synthase